MKSQQATVQVRAAEFRVETYGKVIISNGIIQIAGCVMAETAPVECVAALGIESQGFLEVSVGLLCPIPRIALESLLEQG